MPSRPIKLRSGEFNKNGQAIAAAVTAMNNVLLFMKEEPNTFVVTGPSVALARKHLRAFLREAIRRERDHRVWRDAEMKAWAENSKCRRGV